MQKHVITFGLSVVVTLAAALSASAQLIAYEGFNYTPDTMWANSGSGLSGGTGWGGITWSATATAVASNTTAGLSYGGLTTSGGGVVLGYPQGWPAAGGQTATKSRVLPNTLTNYFSGSGGTIWVSFLYQNWQTTGAINEQRQANFGLYLGASTNASGVSAVNGNERVDVGSVNTYAAGVGGDYMSLWGQNVPIGANTQQSSLATPRGSSTDPVFVVLELVFNNTTAADTVYAWFNPTIGGLDPSTATALSTNVMDFSGANAIRFNGGNQNATGTNAVFMVDELRIGYSFSDVAPVPEPMTFALAGLGGLALLALRRRK
jgi:hypothetical protein